MPIENDYSSNGIHHVNGRQHFIDDENANEELLMGSAVQEIVSNNPGFLIRWGISIFFFILVAIIFACWFVQYPETINASAKLTSVNAPKEVMVKVSGKLVKLFAKEGELVHSGDVLGYMESIAAPQEVIQLIKSLEKLKINVAANNVYQIKDFTNTQYQHLGEVQQQYQTFMQGVIQLRDYTGGGFYVQKRNMLLTDLNNLKRQQNNLSTQKNIQVEDLSLVQKTFDANKKLKEDKVISDLEYRNEQSKLLNKQLSIPQASASLIGNEGQQNEKIKETRELENQIAQQKHIFIQVLGTFESQLQEWCQKYLLLAPIDGRISFSGFLQENQQLKADQTICFVDPGNAAYYMEMNISQNSFGKVKTGQEVLLKFSAYPYQEYGAVDGKLDFISGIATDSGYLAKVVLPKGLTTNYQKQIHFREGLTAQGEIITENRRLLERFYNSVRGMVK